MASFNWMSCIAPRGDRAAVGVPFRSFGAGVLAVLTFSAASAQRAPQVTVGPNVHVSAAHAHEPLGEIWLSADAKDANHLLGCGIVYSPEENRRWTAIYL